MKKLLTISSVGRMIVFFEVIMCCTYSLSVLIVNGADAFSEDHLALLLLAAITIVSAVLLKSRRRMLNKMALWIAILPLLFVSYQSTAAFLTPYHAQLIQHQPAGVLLASFPVR